MRNPWGKGLFGAVLGVVVLISGGCSLTAQPDQPHPITPTITTPPVTNQPGNTPSNTDTATATPTVTPSATAAAPTPIPANQVPWQGSGRFTDVTLPPVTAKPGAKVRRLAFRVEDGLNVNPTEFANFVLTTVNDPRSWANENYHFVPVTERPHTVVTLASPTTSARMCRPLITGGKLSCRVGRKVIFTNYRWASGQRDYGQNLVGYRQYLVNHEIGHSIGYARHLPCPGRGKIAPVMMQQSKGLLGCLPNSWPYPEQ